MRSLQGRFGSPHQLFYGGRMVVADERAVQARAKTRILRHVLTLQ